MGQPTSSSTSAFPSLQNLTEIHICHLCMYVCMPQVTHTWWQLVTHSGILWWICDILTGSSSIRDWVMNLPGDPSSSDTVLIATFFFSCKRIWVNSTLVYGICLHGISLGLCEECGLVIWRTWVFWVPGFLDSTGAGQRFLRLWGWYVDCGQAGRLESILPIPNS